MNAIIGDAGHGGKDSGAVSLDGKILEKDVTLAVTKRVIQLIQPLVEVDVFVTRGKDQFVSLSDRADIANQVKADLFSIHCNAGGGTGFEVFTSRGQTRSDAWATDVLAELGKEFPDRRIRSDFDDGDPDKEANFAVLRRTKNAAILIELGFIDTEEGAEFLSIPDNRERLAQAIARGILKNRGINPSNKPSPRSLTIEERLTRLEGLHPEIE